MGIMYELGHQFVIGIIMYLFYTLRCLCTIPAHSFMTAVLREMPSASTGFIKAYKRRSIKVLITSRPLHMMCSSVWLRVLGNFTK